jgi:hypothetical protein
MFNVYVQDAEQDANTARPISAGGTGATNAAAALANLGAFSTSGGTLVGNITFDMAAERRISFSSAYIYGSTAFGGTVGLRSTSNAKDVLVYTNSDDTLRISSPTTFSTNIQFDMTSERRIGFSNVYIYGNTSGGGTWGLVSTVNAKAPMVYGTTADAMQFNSAVGMAAQLTMAANITFSMSTERRINFASAYLFADAASSGIVGFVSTANAQDIWRYTNSTNTLNLNANTTIGGQAATHAGNIAAQFAALGTNQVGSIALLLNLVGLAFTVGQTSAGSTLAYASASGSSSGNPSGTWQCLGYTNVAGGGATAVTLWKRIA